MAVLLPSRRYCRSTGTNPDVVLGDSPSPTLSRGAAPYADMSCDGGADLGRGELESSFVVPRLITPGRDGVASAMVLVRECMKVTFEQLRKGVQLATGVQHTLVLERIKTHVLELDHLCFGFDSAVLVPCLPPDLGASRAGRPRIPPLVALSFVFSFAEANPAFKILIVGHTDTVGGAAANLAVSDRRAHNVLRFLQGDRIGWAQACEHHQVRDIQLVLDWASRAHGFSSQPGAIDNACGPRTLRAQDRFRRSYNFGFAGHLKCGVAWSADDWKAVYDLYEDTLARYLDVVDEGLAGKRALLKFQSPATLACGEDWPVDGVGIDNLRSTSNRRVDVLFMEDKPYPDLASETPPGLSLFGHSLQFVKKVAPVGPDFLELRLVSADGNPVPEADYKLHLSDGSTRVGKLGRAGTALERAVAKGPFSVEYGPVARIRSCSLAGRVRYALEEPIEWPDVYMVLSESSESLMQIERAYSSYFDSLGRSGLRNDVLNAVRGTAHEVAIDHLLARARVASLSPNTSSEQFAFAYVKVRDGSEDGVTDPGKPSLDTGVGVA